MSVHICPPDHKHGGSTTCYQAHHCRCEPCRANMAAMNRARHARNREGMWGRVQGPQRMPGGVCDRCGIDATGRWPDVLGLVCRDCRDVLNPEVAA